MGSKKTHPVLSFLLFPRQDRQQKLCLIFPFRGITVVVTLTNIKTEALNFGMTWGPRKTNRGSAKMTLRTPTRLGHYWTKARQSMPHPTSLSWTDGLTRQATASSSQRNSQKLQPCMLNSWMPSFHFPFSWAVAAWHVPTLSLPGMDCQAHPNPTGQWLVSLLSLAWVCFCLCHQEILNPRKEHIVLPFLTWGRQTRTLGEKVLFPFCWLSPALSQNVVGTLQVYFRQWMSLSFPWTPQCMFQAEKIKLHSAISPLDRPGGNIRSSAGRAATAVQRLLVSLNSKNPRSTTPIMLLPIFESTESDQKAAFWVFIWWKRITTGTLASVLLFPRDKHSHKAGHSST